MISKSFVVQALERRRLLAGLAMDTTFAANGGYLGTLVADFDDSGISDDQPRSLIFQQNGKVIVLGDSGDLPGVSIALRRYSSEGVLDTSFGNSGLVLFNGESNTGALAGGGFVQSDGSIVVGGETDKQVNGQIQYTPIVARFTPAGQLDPTFGQNGFNDQFASAGQIAQLIPLAGGGFMAVGSSRWRFSANGTLDSTFGVGGTPSVPLTTDIEQATASIVLPDGKILQAFANGMARFNADGTQDSTFSAPNFPNMNSITLQSDGKIIVLTKSTDFPNPDLLVWRLNEDGSVDTTFGTNGSTRINFQDDDEPGGVIVEPDDKIIVASASTMSGQVFTNSALARLLPDGQFDPSFGLDGQLVDPLRKSGSAPGVNINGLTDLALLPDGTLYALGYTGAQAPEDAGNINSSQNVTLRKYLIDAPITVNPGGPYGPLNEGSTLSVAEDGSSYANGTIVDYDWDMVDNGFIFVPQASGQTATLTAGDDPQDLVALRVTTNDGLVTYDAVPVQVFDVPPTATLTVPQYGAVGKPVSIHPVSTAVVPEQFQNTLDFGDGTTPSTLKSIQATKIYEPTVTHTYTSPGDYNLTFTANDGDGGITSTTGSIDIVNIVAQEFVDTNGNGVQDAHEVPLGGLQIYIDENNNGVLDPGEPVQTSGSDGLVGFSGLGAGTYRLRAVLPGGYNYTTPAVGYVDATITSSSGAIATFGITSDPVVSGNVFTDANGDGVKSTLEAGVPSDKLFADLNDDGIPGPEDPIVTTDANGNYRIGIPGGKDGQAVVIRNEGIFAWTQTAPVSDQAVEVAVTPGQVSVAPNIGMKHSTGGVINGEIIDDLNGNGVFDLLEPLMTSGAVYIDLNGDGVRQPTEPVGGVFNESTGFSIGGLTPGTYSVRLVVADGFSQTFPGSGGARTAVITGSTTIQNFNFLIHNIVPPTVSASFDYLSSSNGQRVVLNFSEPVATLGAADISLANETTGSAVSFTVQGTGATRYIVPVGTPPLSDGNYRLTVPARAIVDTSGNQSTSDVVFDFFVLAGDANHDGVVNATDFDALAASYGKSGMGFAQGDFNYDGEVNAIDFNILASRFDVHLDTLDGSRLDAVISNTQLALSAPSAPPALFGDNKISNSGIAAAIVE